MDLEYKEVRNSGIIDYDEEGQLLSMNSYKISNKLTPTKILQVENAKNNQFLVRTYYRSYRCKLADPLEETKEPFEVLNQINFPGEVYNCISSPFFEEKHIYLYGNNELAIIDDNKPSSIVIDISYLTQNVPKFNDKHVFELMDSSYHPSIFLLSNLRMTTLYDIREKEMRLLVNGQQPEELKITYALKYLEGQFFATSNEQHLCIYDLRYPEKPVYSFLNLCDENPPNVLGISEPYDPFNTDCIGDAEGLVSVLENLDIDTEITDLSNERILYGFSTLKNGSALLFPNKIFERLETDRDKYFTQTEKDCYMAHLDAMDLKISNFSYLKFNKYNHPKMLFTSNILDSQFRIRGLKVTHFGKDLLVQGTDNDNNMIFHIVRENQGEYKFMPMPSAEDAGTKSLDMWIHLKNKIENKVYKQESPSIFKEEVQIDPEKIIKMIPDTLDDVSVHSDEFEPPPEEEHFDSYTLRNVAEIIVGTETKYDLAYGLLAKKRKKDRLYNIAPEGSIDITEKIKTEELEGQPLPNSQLSGGFSTQALLMGSQGDQQGTGRTIEDLKRTAKTFVVNQSIIDYLSQDQW